MSLGYILVLPVSGDRAFAVCVSKECCTLEGELS